MSPMLGERTLYAAVAHGEKIYVIGRFQFRNTVEVYDTKSNRWSVLPHMRHSRDVCMVWCSSVAKSYAQIKYSMSFGLKRVYESLCSCYLQAAALGDYVYAIGGLDGVSPLASVERFHTITEEWETVANLPKPVWSADAISFHGKIFVAGELLYIESHIEAVLHCIIIDCIDNFRGLWFGSDVSIRSRCERMD
jgi:Kelch motif